MPASWWSGHAPSPRRCAGAQAPPKDEDAGTARIVERSEATLKAGRDVILPAAVAEAIVHGENALRVIREWRSMTQAQLGNVATKVGQSTTRPRRPAGPGHAGDPAAADAGPARVRLDLLMVVERGMGALQTAPITARSWLGRI